MKLISLARKIWNLVLDIIFPRTSREEVVHRLTTETARDQVAITLDASDLESEGIFPILNYKNDTTRALIWELKYKRNAEAIRILGKIAGEEITAIISELQLWENFSNPILIPIPLSSKRQRDRGFNQTELLAEEIIKNLNNEITLEKEILIKIRHTETQTSQKGKKAREKNLRGCFFVRNKEKIKGRNIILLDDVVTTGSTIREARKTLMKAGASKVIALTVAH